MELTKMNDCAWMWVALDYADEEMRVEKLCIRFKTADEAANFKDAFDDAKTIVALNEMSPDKSKVETPNARTASIPETTVKVSPTSTNKVIRVGGFTFASPPTFKVDTSNAAQSSSKDSTKDREKGAAEAVKPSPFAGFSFTSPPKTSDSAAVTSTETAPLRRPRTALPKPVVTSPVASTTVSTPPNLNTEVAKKTELKPSDRSGPELMFDSNNSSLTFSALAATNKVPAFKKDADFKGWEGEGRSVFEASKTEEAEDNEGTVEEFEPDAEFKPVIPLPELVDVKTGEEDETVLFKERAKLLRFDSEGKQWKERGIGLIKIMKHPSTGKVRLLMRREQVFKVCCNHFLNKDIKFTKLTTSDRAWTWYAQDYSEGEMKPELFAIKFKTADQALKFKEAIDKVQLDMSSVAEQTRPVWKCEKCIFPNASDASRCLSCEMARPRQMNQSPAFVLPTNDQQPKLMEISKLVDSWVCQACCYKNEGKDNCAGCGVPKVKPLSEFCKPKYGSWECKTCLIRNDGTADLCAACETPKPGSKTASCETPKPGSKTVPKGSTAANFSFGVPKSNTSNVPLSDLFKPKQGSWECNACYTRNEGDKFTCVSCTIPKPGCEEKQKENVDSNKLQFGIAASGTGFNLESAQNTPLQTEFTFGINPNRDNDVSEGIKFNFGIPTSTVTTASSALASIFAASDANKSGFTFSSQASNAPVSTPSVFNTDAKTTNKPFSFEPRSPSGTFLFGNTTTSGAGGNTSAVTFSFGQPDPATAKEAAGEHSVLI